LKGKNNAMKKTFLVLTALLSLVILAACGTKTSVTQTVEGGTSSSGTLTADYQNALSIPLQLLVGTYKLEGTANAVDAKIATDLLPLWKTARSLSSSTSSTAAELDAVYKQIEETMTPAQIQAIAAMKLTRDDMMKLMTDQGLDAGFAGGGQGTFTPEQQATRQAARQNAQGAQDGGPRGDMGGGPPAGGQGGVPGGDMGGGQGFFRGTGTPNPNFANRGTMGISTALYDAVIKLLEGKTA
jgi:hypothetical protein